METFEPILWQMRKNTLFNRISLMESPLQDMDNLTPEERQVRLKKADSIRRMLAEQSTTGKRNAGTTTFFIRFQFWLRQYSDRSTLLGTFFANCQIAHAQPRILNERK